MEVASTAERVIVQGMERSIFPVKMTAICPAAMMPKNEARRNCCVKNVGEIKFGVISNVPKANMTTIIEYEITTLRFSRSMFENRTHIICSPFRSGINALYRDGYAP